MKTQKRVTPAVRAANKINAQASTGPSTKQGKSNASYNAVRHGILARRVVLETDEQREEFQELLRSCEAEFRPVVGLLEKFLTEDVAVAMWKLGIVEELETQELLRRQDLSDEVDGVFTCFGKGLELPIDKGDIPLDRGWDCERLVVRAKAGKDRGQSDASCGSPLVQGEVIDAVRVSRSSHNDNMDHLELEAVLVSTLESVTRYKAKVKRDLYRAIEALHSVQSERRERRMLKATVQSDADEHQA